MDSSEPPEPFQIPYGAVIPALSVILASTKKTNQSHRLEWLNAMCRLFDQTLALEEDRFHVELSDLGNRSSHKQWLKRVFGCTFWASAVFAHKSPKVWGKYMWALLHFISTLYSTETAPFVVFLLEHCDYVLPCQECQRNFRATKMPLIDSNVTAVNAVVALRNSIKRSQYLTLVPENNTYTFQELYDYLEPLIDVPAQFLTTNGGRRCSCGGRK